MRKARAYLSARKANTAESIPLEKSTATLASPRCFLGRMVSPRGDGVTHFREVMLLTWSITLRFSRDTRPSTAACNIDSGHCSLVTGEPMKSGSDCGVRIHESVRILGKNLLHFVSIVQYYVYKLVPVVNCKLTQLVGERDSPSIWVWVLEHRLPWLFLEHQDPLTIHRS